MREALQPGTVADLIKAMFDESPLALEEYFDKLSDDDQTFAAGFIQGFMWCMFMEDAADAAEESAEG